MWREFWHRLLALCTGRTEAGTRDVPSTDTSAKPAQPAAHEASDTPWPYGHHVPPDVEEQVERHRGEWRS